MARDINDIEREIERTRRQLAGTLDELADRTKPQNLVEDAKATAADKARDPKVQKIALGIAAAAVVLVVVGVTRSRRARRDLRDIRAYLAKNS